MVHQQQNTAGVKGLIEVRGKHFSLEKFSVYPFGSSGASQIGDLIQYCIAHDPETEIPKMCHKSKLSNGKTSA